MIVVYHWWGEEKDRVPHLNLRVPVIHSIATLRGVNKDIKIVVLDGTEQDYCGWDRRLNFQVIPIKFTLSGYNAKPGWRNLSRLLDLQTFSLTCSSDVIIYSDADVFWLRDPLPLECGTNRFCFNKWNSGFFYFSKSSLEVQWFFELFKAYVTVALNDDNFRVITRAYTDYDEWYYVLDETILTYMWYKMPWLFNILSPSEHFAPSSLASVDLTSIKMLHCHGTIVENPLEKEEWRRRDNRGLCPLLIEELRENMKKAIGEGGIRELYGNISLPSVSLKDKEFIGRFLASKNKLFNLTAAIYN